MFFFTHQRSQMAPSTTQLLRSAEALTIPRVQVIVLNANMRCLECRDRVSKVLSEMDNLLDYVVDATQKKVTVRGRVDPKKRMQRIKLMANYRKRKAMKFERLRSGGSGYSTDLELRSGGSEYSTDLEQQYRSNSWKKSTASLIQRACCFRWASD